VHARELVEVDGDDDKLGYAVSSVQDGRIIDEGSLRTRIAAYIDREQTWGWVSVSDGTV
jgi:hypothetical protein